MLTNIRCLRNKTDELSAILHSNNVDICCVSETWLNENTPTESVDIEHYICYRRDRSDGRKCGGVACYIRSDLPCSRMEFLETPSLETLWLLYRQPCMPRSLSHIAICVVYHPPDADSRAMTSHLINAADTVLRLHPDAGVVLLGDFNRLNEKPLCDYPLKQVVKRATRKSAVLDKIFTNIAAWYRSPTVMPAVGKSDHNTVLFVPESNCNVARGQKVL